MSNALETRMTLFGLLGGQGDAGIEISGITADSREVKKGYLFAALKGSRSDGRAFIPQAIERGAAALLVPAGSMIRADIPVIEDPRPARRLAQMAAAFYQRQPRIMAAVTGTNGKTSTASFTRQLWELLGAKAASIGTLGIERDDGIEKGQLTSPDPITLQRTVARLAGDGIDHAICEASSHGLVQYRLDGLRFSVGAFTNLGHDHLDYHRTRDAYFQSKARLFSELLPDDGAAVIMLADEHGERMADAARGRGYPVITVGRAPGATLTVLSARSAPEGQDLELLFRGDHHRAHLPLAGGFQADNALLAAAIVIASGAQPGHVFEALDGLKPVPGRLEKIGETASGGAVYVDFAHTPDGLQTVLLALREHCPGRLIVAFGCGGDRDRSKRSEMGRIAARLSDSAIITDDNPRSENPAAIRAEIRKGAPEAQEIGDRRQAIAAGIKGLLKGDILVIAGKGHEDGQIVGETIHPFSDRDVAREILAGDVA